MAGTRAVKKRIARKKPARGKSASKKPPRKKPLPKRPARKKLPRKPPKLHHPVKRPHRLPEPYRWLQSHPDVAAAIKWQFRPADPNNVYTPPGASDKVAFPNWSPQQKADLRNAYIECRDWFDAGANQVPMGTGGLTDMPVNVNANVNDDMVTVMQEVTPEYMWKLYIEHVAFALAAEMGGNLPWSIAQYGNTALRYLFDSTTMAWNLGGNRFGMGTYAVYVPALRRDTRPKTAFAPPRWTYPFLVQKGLIANSRLDTIGRILQWMRQNLWHFFGTDNFGTCAAVWQYRGYPPISCITEGTIDSNNPGQGRQHWTLGCHGSVGFLNALLRVVNVPVQPVWIGGHELAYFITERRYLDHGDDPYNQNVKNSTQPILNVLINESTYATLFTINQKINIIDPNDPAVANVGYTAVNFPP